MTETGEKKNPKTHEVSKISPWNNQNQSKVAMFS